MDETIGQILKDGMARSGITLRQLADETGIGMRTISRHLSDATSPNLPQMQGYADALGIVWVVGSRAQIRTGNLPVNAPDAHAILAGAA